VIGILYGDFLGLVGTCCDQDSVISILDQSRNIIHARIQNQLHAFINDLLDFPIELLSGKAVWWYPVAHHAPGCGE